MIGLTSGLESSDNKNAQDRDSLPPMGNQEINHVEQPITASGEEQLFAEGSQLAAECLVAVTGIYPTSAPTKMQLHIAEPSRYVAKLGKRIDAFLKADKPEKFKTEKLPDQRATYEKITDIPDPGQVEQWTHGLPPEVALPYSLTIQAARAKVQESWPVYPDTSLGLHNFDLAPDELMDVIQVLRTLDSPESILDDLDARVLLPSQVDLIAAYFPDLYQEICKLCSKAVEPYIEIPGFVEKKKSLSALKEEQLRVLMKLPTDAPMVAQPEAPQPPMQNPSRSSSRGSREDASNLKTPSEHTAERRIANK